MANYKFVNITVSEGDKKDVINQYGRMGFELINSICVTTKNDKGTVTSTRYECTFKFDRDQKNADRILAIHKDYSKKRNVLRYLHSDEFGEMLIHPKTFFGFVLIFTVILIPLAPALIGNGIFDFSSTSIFSSSSDFDTTTFLLSVLMAIGGGFAIAPFAAMIKLASTRNKRMVLAIEKIPQVEAEIEELLKKAEELRI